MTKHLTTRLLLVILACMIGTNGYSYDIAIKNAQGIDIYYNYVNNNKDLEVTFLSSENPSYSGDITIPEEITYLDKTYKVVYIGDFAFATCKELVSVNISNSITCIVDYAFAGRS